MPRIAIDEPHSEIPAPPAAQQRMRITGLHHATLISSDLERTTRFYRDVLGLALWREGANDDDPGARHFWFSADASGAPGTIISFLEYPQMDAGDPGDRGDASSGARGGLGPGGRGMARLPALTPMCRPRRCFERGGLASVYLRDPDAHIIEICAAA